MFKMRTLAIKYLYVNNLQTMVVVSKRDISPGEEICHSYHGFNEMYPQTPNRFDPDGQKPLGSFQDARIKIMEARWKITCADNCFCRNEALDAAVIKGKWIFERLRVRRAPQDYYRPEDAAYDLKNIAKLLPNLEVIHGATL